MTITAIDWLPDEALNDPRLRNSIEEVISLWSKRWLGSDRSYRLSLAKPTSPANGARIENAGWRKTDTAMSFGWSEEFGVSLALAIVDASDRKFPRSAQDKALLLELAWETLVDLAKSVDTALRVDRSFASENGDRQVGFTLEWQMRGSPKALPDFHFIMPKQFFASARKALIGSAIGDIAKSGSIADACGETRIDVEVIVGNASINWGDLKHLEKGDVLVLDRETVCSFPLKTTKSGSEICRLKVTQEDGLLKLLKDDPPLKGARE